MLACAAPHIGPVDPHRAPRACCVYRLTNIKSGKTYIGKTVDSLEKYIKGIGRRKIGIIGNALRKHGRAAFRSEILLVGTEDFCFRDVIDGKRGGMERALIAAYGTLSPGGYNLTPGGDGFTSEGMRRWHATPAGRETSVRAGRRSVEMRRQRAGYPMRRVLAELEKEPRTIDSMVALLGLSKNQVTYTLFCLRTEGHYIVCKGPGDGAGIYRLVTFEEAADHWASGRALTNIDRVLGALMEGPRTIAELMAFLGANRNTASANIDSLRKKGYTIESRGASNVPGGGTYHLIIDHKRHPWLHLGMIDLRGAARDDPTFSLQDRKE